MGRNQLSCLFGCPTLVKIVTCRCWHLHDGPVLSEVDLLDMILKRLTIYLLMYPKKGNASQPDNARKSKRESKTPAV